MSEKGVYRKGSTTTQSAHMPGYRHAILTREFAAWLLSDQGGGRYREIDSALFTVGGDRCTNILAGEEIREIIRVSEGESICRISVNIYDDLP